MLFEGKDAVFVNESNYKKILNSACNIDGAVLISAFGGKSAIPIARDLYKKGIEIRLFTCNKNALVMNYIDPSRVFLFPKQREPYTYNTSTYMGMLLANTRENPGKIFNYIKTVIDPLLDIDFSKYSSFVFIIPEQLYEIKGMFEVKFVELFGRKIPNCTATLERMKHAVTVVDTDDDLFVSFGCNNNIWGKYRLGIPLSKDIDYAGMMAIGYYVIGKIQEQKPKWFEKSIEKHCKDESAAFGHKIEPIVE